MGAVRDEDREPPPDGKSVARLRDSFMQLAEKHDPSSPEKRNKKMKLGMGWRIRLGYNMKAIRRRLKLAAQRL